MALPRTLAAVALLPVAAISLQISASTRGDLAPRHHQPAYALARHATVSLLGDGIGLARFGESTSTVSAHLDAIFGPPERPRLTHLEQDCNVTASLTWPTLTAYLHDDRFVGYGYTTDTGYGYGDGDTRQRASARAADTAAGLGVGDSVAAARRIYGTRLRTYETQSGSWSAETPQGTLRGYLTALVTKHGRTARIATIGAGDVGCPAMSP
jgi:hypothetical protein